MKSKQTQSPKGKRKTSALETQLRLSIKFAKLEARINALEAEVLSQGRKKLFQTFEHVDWVSRSP